MQTMDLDAAAALIEARRAHWSEAGFEVGPLTWSAEPPWHFATRSETPDPASLGVHYKRGSVEVDIVIFAPPWGDSSWLDIIGIDLTKPSEEAQVWSPEIPDLETFARILDETFDRWSAEAAP